MEGEETGKGTGRKEKWGRGRERKGKKTRKERNVKPKVWILAAAGSYSPPLTKRRVVLLLMLLGKSARGRLARKIQQICQMTSVHVRQVISCVFRCLAVLVVYWTVIDLCRCPRHTALWQTCSWHANNLPCTLLMDSYTITLYTGCFRSLFRTNHAGT